MNNRYKKNWLVIHLNKFRTEVEIQTVLTDNGIEIISAQALFQMKADGYTKVFLDATTHELFAFCHTSLRSQIKFCDEFLDMLKNDRSIDFVKEPQNLSIDLVLDKINERGIDSLNRYEREFLEKYRDSGLA